MAPRIRRSIAGIFEILAGGILDIIGTWKISGTTVSTSAAELNFNDGALAGTQVASKAVVADANVNTGVSKVTELHIGTSGSETKVDATPEELNQLDASAADGTTIAFVDVQLTAAQINDLKDTNIELVAAPAAGLALIPVAIHIVHIHGGTNFIQAAGTDALAILYNGGSEITELATEAQMTTLIEASADDFLYCPLPLAGAAFVPKVAAAIDLDNNGATDMTTGDGTFSIRTYFRVVRMVAFT